MKKIILLIGTLIFFSGSLFSQTMGDLKKLVEEKKFVEAGHIIQDVLEGNRNNLDFFILAGDIYFELDKLDSAVIMYERADDIDGGEAPIMRKLAKAYSATEQHQKAFDLIKDLIDDEPDNVENVLALGYAYLRSDSLGKAELFFTKAKKLDDSNPEAFVALGELYLAQRVYELAKSNFEEALALDEENVQARIKLATAYYWLANKAYDNDEANELFAKSLKEWNTVTKQDPLNAKAWFQQGKIWFFASRFEEAAKSLYEYVNLRPEGNLGRWYLAQSLYEVGACDSAETHLIRSRDNIDSVKTKAQLYLATCYFDKQKYNKAVDAFEKLETMQDLTPDDLKRYAGAALNIQDTALAVKKFVESVEADPSQCDLMYTLGQLFTYKMKDYENAHYILTKRAEHCQDDKLAETYYLMGLAHFFSINEEDTTGATEMSIEAQKDLSKAIEIDSTFLRAKFYLADVIYSKGNSQEAVDMFKSVITEASEDTAKYGNFELKQAHIKLYGVYADKGQYSNIKDMGLNWSKIQPEEPYAYLFAAIGYQGSGDLENACRYYKRVIKYDPDNTTAKKNIGALNCNSIKANN